MNHSNPKLFKSDFHAWTSPTREITLQVWSLLVVGLTISSSGSSRLDWQNKLFHKISTPHTSMCRMNGSPLFPLALNANLVIVSDNARSHQRPATHQPLNDCSTRSRVDDRWSSSCQSEPSSPPSRRFKSISSSSSQATDAKQALAPKVPCRTYSGEDLPLPIHKRQSAPVA